MTRWQLTVVLLLLCIGLLVSSVWLPWGDALGWASVVLGVLPLYLATRARTVEPAWDVPRTATAVLLLIGLIVLAVARLFVHDTPARSSPTATSSSTSTCIEAVGIDRSPSQFDLAVLKRWEKEVAAIVERASHCAGRVLVETVYDRPGMQRVKAISLQVQDDQNPVLKRAKQAQLEQDARNVIYSFMAAPARGHTNLLTWFDSVEAHLKDMPGNPTVNATLLSDGINNSGDVNMQDSSFLKADAQALVTRIKLPNCSGWTVRVLGANTIGADGVPSALAAKAREFWRTFIQACGGELKRYDVPIE
jgi:hypothetical protein